MRVQVEMTWGIAVLAALRIQHLPLGRVFHGIAFKVEHPQPCLCHRCGAHHCDAITVRISPRGCPWAGLEAVVKVQPMMEHERGVGIRVLEREAADVSIAVNSQLG